jgi:hypothetical protein
LNFQIYFGKIIKKKNFNKKILGILIKKKKYLKEKKFQKTQNFKLKHSKKKEFKKKERHY